MLHVGLDMSDAVPTYGMLASFDQVTLHMGMCWGSGVEGADEECCGSRVTLTSRQCQHQS